MNTTNLPYELWLEIFRYIVFDSSYIFNIAHSCRFFRLILVELIDKYSFDYVNYKSHHPNSTIFIIQRSIYDERCIECFNKSDIYFFEHATRICLKCIRPNTYTKREIINKYKKIIDPSLIDHIVDHIYGIRIERGFTRYTLYLKYVIDESILNSILF